MYERSQIKTMVLVVDKLLGNVCLKFILFTADLILCFTNTLSHIDWEIPNSSI